MISSRLGWMLAALALLIGACSHDPEVDIVAPDGSARAHVEVEVADNARTREAGLMYRNHLDDNAGMIFVFDGPQHLSFWMKNTEIPLDMIFADENGKIVGVVQNAEPYTENPREVAGDSEYVLEVNGGYAARHHISSGDRMLFGGFNPQASH